MGKNRMRVEHQVRNEPLDYRPVTHGELGSMTKLNGPAKVRRLSRTKQGGQMFSLMGLISTDAPKGRARLHGKHEQESTKDAQRPVQCASGADESGTRLDQNTQPIAGSETT